VLKEQREMDKKQEYICRECSHPAVVEYTPPSELGETRSSIYYCAPCSLLRQHQRRVRDWKRSRERAGRDWLGRKRIEPKPEFWDYIPAYRWKRLGGPAQPLPPVGRDVVPELGLRLDPLPAEPVPPGPLPRPLPVPDPALVLPEEGARGAVVDAAPGLPQL